jgi:hypothetical protein
MKQFVLTTQSESGDNYIYFIECKTKPTDKQLDKFLMEHGNDVDEDTIYENVEHLKEIKDFITIE